jgi:hypothetical protein
MSHVPASSCTSYWTLASDSTSERPCLHFWPFPITLQDWLGSISIRARVCSSSSKEHRNRKSSPRPFSIVHYSPVQQFRPPCLCDAFSLIRPDLGTRLAHIDIITSSAIKYLLQSFAVHESERPLKLLRAYDDFKIATRATGPVALS